MAFFNQDPPAGSPENEARAAQSDESRPGKSAPLFKQEASLPGSISGQHISLSAYISKHLNADPADSGLDPDWGKPDAADTLGGSSEGTGPTSQLTQPSAHAGQTLPANDRTRFGGQTRESLKALPGGAGQLLNSLDVELTAGLEQYMPTPIFRLRVVKKRLDAEMQELRLKLNKYERLPDQSRDMRERVNALHQRLETLARHEREVSRELAAALHLGPGITHLLEGGKAAGNQMDAWGRQLHGVLSRLFYGQAYADLETAGATLQDLQEIFAERLNDTQVSDTEISQLMTRYEQTLVTLETAALRMKSPAGLPQRLWQQAQRLVK